MDLRSRAAGGVGLALFSAFLYGSYYPLVVRTSSAANSAVLVFPFLFGGVLLTLAFLRPSRATVAPVQARIPLGLYALAGALLAALQAEVLLSTRFAGGVPTSLFALLGQVMGIPVIGLLAWKEGVGPSLTPAFWGGTVIAGAGASLAIISGGSASFVPLDVLAFSVPIPFLVGGYFVLVARLTYATPSSRVIPPVTLLASLFSGIGVVALTGGVSALVSGTAWDYATELVIGVAVFLAAPLAFFEASKRLSLVVPAILNSTAPVFALVLLVTFAGARIPVLYALAIPMAILGSVVVILSRRPRPEPVLPKDVIGEEA